MNVSESDRFIRLLNYMDPTVGEWDCMNPDKDSYEPMGYAGVRYPSIYLPTSRKALWCFRDYAMLSAAGCLDSGLLG